MLQVGFNKSESEEFHMHRRIQTRDQIHMKWNADLSLFQNNAVIPFTRAGFDLQWVAEYEMFLRRRMKTEGLLQVFIMGCSEPGC